MQNSVKKMLRQMFRDKKRQKRIVAVICALSVLVATGVFNELMQPVITMTPDPVCGVAEHAHTSECYQNQLVCGIEESEEHAHGDGCFESVLACGKSEHKHGDSCYPEEIKDQPVVTAEPEVTAEPTEVPAVPATVSEEAPEVTAEPETTEVPEVTAEPESTEAPEVTAEPEITAEPEVTAEPETTEVPEVTAEPETTAEPEVTAEPETTAEPDPTAEPAAPAITGATASAETAFVGQTVTWTFAAEGASELTYSIDDSEGNSVASGALDAGATCVSWLADRAGAFTLTVTAVNEFGAASITGAVTVEAAAELTAAVRGDSASAFAGESATFHFAVSGGVEPTAISITVEQDGETLAALDAMTDSVTVESRHMGDKVTTLTATITAADSLGTTVSDSVQIPVAVRIHETESDWIKATETELTDDWRENLIAVAKTQLGYEESRLDFVIDEEGNAQGYTRYGQWWGASHDEWCAMFASFCLNYAEIPDNDFPREANCEKWIDALNSRGLYAASDEVQPEAGDLIFFDWENDGKCDHVGIVTDADTETIATIEGNSAASVRTREYEAGDECIIGFGLLTKAFERHLADELDLDLETGVGAQALVLEDAILRAEPASDSMELAALTAETLVTVTAAEQNLDKVWYEVTTGDLTGYLPAATLQLNYIAIEDELIPVEADGNAGIMTLEAEATEIEGLVPNEYYASTSSSTTKLNVNYAVEASVVFIPVDSEGNELTDVEAPATVRTTLNYTGKGYRKEFKDTEICPEVDQYVGADNVYSVSLCIKTDGVESEVSANYVSIFSLWNATPSTGCYFTYGDTYDTCVNYLYNSDAYFVVRYIHSETYTATFVNGDTTVEERTVNAGEVLGELPEPPVAEDGSTFIGWAVTNAEGEKVYATAETVIAVDTIYEAVYATPATVQFVYLDSETNAQTSVYADQTVDVDTVLTFPTQDSFIENSYPEGAVLTGWQVLNGDTYDAVVDPYTVTGDTVFYAVFQLPVSVTFYYEDGDDATADSYVYTVSYGTSFMDALAQAMADETNSLPEPAANRTTADGTELKFVGWKNGQDANGDSNISADEYVDAATVTSITEAIVFTALYAEDSGYTVTFHDIGVDGKTELGDKTFEVLVPTGVVLADYLSEIVLHDDTSAADVLWYNATRDDESGAITKGEQFDVTAVLTSDVDLYTFTYQITLQLSSATQTASLLDYLMPVANAEVEVSDDGTQLTITLREGETLKASDLIVTNDDGSITDYTLYSWTGADGSAYNLNDLIGQPMTADMSVTLTSGDYASEDQYNLSAQFYVRRDNSWDLIKTQDVVALGVNLGDIDGGYTRWCISATQLELVYADYGFVASDLKENGARLFGYSANGDGDPIYFDRPNQKIGDNVYLPTVSSYHTTYGWTTVAVYYLPANTITGTGTSESAGKSNLTANTFYSITVTDPGNIVYESDDDIPAVQYVLTGGSKSVVVKNPEDGKYAWTCTGNVSGTSADGYTTFNITNASKAYVISLEERPAYSITVVDENHVVYSTLELNAINAVHDSYSQQGTDSATITLEAPVVDYYVWQCDGVEGEVNTGNGTVTFTIDSVQKDYTIELIKLNTYTVTSIDRFGVSTVEEEVLAATSDARPATVTLVNTEGFTWTCTDANGDIVTGTDNGDGTVTFEIDDVKQNYTIQQSVADGYYLITYDVNIKDSSSDTAHAYPVVYDPEYTPKVNAHKVYVIAVQNGTAVDHTVLAPNPLTYVAVDENTVDEDAGTSQRMLEWDFVGWATTTDAESSTYTAGKSVQITGTTTLYGVWEEAATGNAERVDFYVYFDCTDEELPAGTAAAFYTQSVFATKLVQGSERTLNPVIGRDAFDSSIHPIIRDQLAGEGFTYTSDGAYYNNTVYQIADYPDDDYVLKQLRNLQEGYIETYESVKNNYASAEAYVNAQQPLIVYNGEYIPADMLTSRYFMLEWYVFKYQDGWHIDGRLVPRPAQLTIEKSFYGNSAMIEAVKNGTYQITVSGAFSDGTTSRTLTLAGADEGSGPLTYTWTLDESVGLIRGNEYTINEDNYIASGYPEYCTTAEFIVRNSETYANANQWIKYNDSKGVTVEVTSYDPKVDVYQTVHLTNSYVPLHTMVVHKINASTGANLANVEFQLQDASGNVVPLYYNSANGVYQMDAVSGVEATKTVQTDANGRFMIGWGAPQNSAYTNIGDFKLVEVSALDGYNRIDPVEFNIKDTCIGDSDTGEVTITEISNDANADGYTLTILNTPQVFHVAVKKDWASGTPQEVELELYRLAAGSNERVLIDTVTLNGSEKPTAWEYEWDGLPLYDGNGAAEYIVVEKRIGNTNYSDTADADDGYANYVVTIDAMKYQDNDLNDFGGAIVNGVQAYRALITVHNRVDTGTFDFTKTNGTSPLAGASFALYSIADSINESALTAVVEGDQVVLKANNSTNGITQVGSTATSQSDGTVSFGTVALGTYYMVETSAPEHYAQNTNVYRVIVAKDAETITLLDSGTTVSSIFNSLSEVSVTLYKMYGSTPLAGAVFEVYSDAECRTVVATSPATGDTGATTITDLAIGTYYLKEKTAPTGYKLIDDVFTLEVKSNGTWTLKDSAGTDLPNIQNTPATVSVTLNKVDANDNALAGATFELRKKSSGVYGKVEDYFSTDGTEFSWTLSDLAPGDYKIVETEAPDGYYMMAGTIDFTVSNGALVFPDGTPYDEVTNTYSGDAWTYNVATNTFTVTNMPGVELPSTGGPGKYIYTICGLFFMAASLLCGIGQRRKRERGEEI